MRKDYTLCIEGLTPDTISAARLASYMGSLARLLGHEDAVRFHLLKAGSIELALKVDEEAVCGVENQLDLVKKRKGSRKATKACEEIDLLLQGDKTCGFIYEGENKEDEKARILEFPGVARSHHEPVSEEGSLDGKLCSVSGAVKTVYLQLQNGETRYSGIETDRITARELAKHMYEQVRIFGTGEWQYDRQGNWILQKFSVQSYQVLVADSLRDVIDQMREIEGSGWQKMEDPIGAWRVLRGKGDGSC